MGRGKPKRKISPTTVVEAGSLPPKPVGTYSDSETLRPNSGGVRHGAFNVSLLIGFATLSVCILIAYEIGYVRSNIGEETKALFHLTVTLEDHFASFTESWRKMQRMIPKIFEMPIRPGINLREGVTIEGKNVTSKHPVILIPGIVSSKLELWQGRECATGDFRCQYWGSTKMLEALLLRKSCWLEHISLNHTTGLDPEGIKLRAAEGMSASDFLIGDYWVWEKVIHNLADIGYDTNSMHLAAYDWRLSNLHLEERDGFFSKLKLTVEFMRRKNREKVVLLGHSMGGIVIHFFLQWVESPHGGNGGPSWVEQNVEAYVNIAGPLLGVPKTQSALLSGEMKDTAELSGLMEYIQENFISSSDLRKMFRSFGSLPSMIPKGGDKIWGNATTAPDDIPRVSRKYGFTHGNMIDISYKLPVPTEEFLERIENVVVDDDSLELFSEDTSEPAVIEGTALLQDILEKLNGSLTSEGFVEFLRLTSPSYLDRIKSHDSWGLSRNITAEYDDPRYWNNPLESKLPNAPNMKIFNLYGVGKGTERSYFYGYDNPDRIRIAKNMSFPEALINYGVRLGPGDGTVPLLSLGFMGLKGWKDPVYNPSNISSIVKEYQHNPELISAGRLITDRFRGGIATADHVDIMGNHELLLDILLIVSGHGNMVHDRIISDLEDIVDKITLD